MLENSFYIRCENFKNLVELLMDLSSMKVTREEPPLDISFRERSVPGSRPGLLYIYRNQNGWCGVDHNARDPLYEWGALLSKSLKTEFFQVQTYRLRKDSTHESNYLLYYNQGKLRREIKVITSRAIPLVDKGKRFNFELPYIHAVKQYNKIDIDRQWELFDKYGYFTSDTLDEYCLRLGFDPSYADEPNTVLLKKPRFRRWR